MMSDYILEDQVLVPGLLAVDRLRGTRDEEDEEEEDDDKETDDEQEEDEDGEDDGYSE